MARNLEKEFEAVIDKEIRERRIPGANILVTRHGETLYSGNFGMADVERNIPMKSDTLFRMFSMSKMVTSCAAMILFERGQIGMNDPVGMYLDGFKDQKVFNYETGKCDPLKSPMTIGNLLNMTSGLCYPDEANIPTRMTIDLFDEISKAQDEGKLTGTVDFANRMGKLPLMFKPGSRWNYGTSADVMGAVVEVVSGMRYGEFLQKEIFDPIGMNETGFYLPAGKENRFAQVYRVLPDEADETKSRLSVYTDKSLGMEGYSKAPAFESGGAGLVSTIEDYRKFGQALLNGGKAENGNRILGAKTVKFMRTPAVSEEMLSVANWDSLKGYGYGNFNRVLMDSARGGTNAPVGEYGWDGWLGTYITLDPEDDFLFEYFIQICDSGTTEIVKRLRSIAYGMLED